MRIPTRTGRSITWPGAFFVALAAWGMLAPSEARAGCRHPGLTGSDATVRLAALDRIDDADAPAPAPPPRPCNGPSCSEREAPPPAPGSTTHEPEQRWALGVISIPDVETGPGFACPTDAHPRPSRDPLSIFHPPRLPVTLAAA